jgi:hypothetical protein
MRRVVRSLSPVLVRSNRGLSVANRPGRRMRLRKTSVNQPAVTGRATVRLIALVGFANSPRSSPTASLARFSSLAVVVKEGCLLWSFAYLGVPNLFALVWLLARPRRSKELEILVLRHELAMLRRQTRQPKLTRADRALLAALSRSLPRVAWAGFPVKPETLLRWHRQLVARRWTYTHRAPGRPPLESSLRSLIVRLAWENPHLGYRRIVGELKGLAITVSATSVRKVLLQEGLQPAPERSHSDVARVPARACGEHACLRLPHRRDRVSPADLRVVLHLARDATDRVHRLHLESRRALGNPASAQPRHAARR